MDSSAILVVAIGGVLVLAGAVIVATAHRQAGLGRPDPDAVKRDQSAGQASEPGSALAARGPDLDNEARTRAATTRRALAPTEPRAPVPRVPIDEEELGVTRRQFFNRGILLGQGLAVGGFGVACLAFLWPTGAGGFGGEIAVGSLDDVKASFEDKEPFYNASAKTYIAPYPAEDIANAQKVYDPSIVAGMEQGYVALYQKCPHLGCRVPWCETSQWFECPCHGSKYNRVGEKRGGPAPRGMDRFALSISGGAITVDTGTVFIGPAIGTDTTGQSAEGAPCV